MSSTWLVFERDNDYKGNIVTKLPAIGRRHGMMQDEDAGAIAVALQAQMFSP